MPTFIACAVVRDDPPEMFIADDIETLNWVLALQLIARTPGNEIPLDKRERLRTALREEMWGDAVELWMEILPGVVDVYPAYSFYSAQDVVLAAEELQFTPLFRD